MLSLSEFYMLSTLAVTALCWIASLLESDAQEVFLAALLILFLSSVTQIARTYIGHPYSLAVHPVQDVICVALFSAAYISNRSRWAAALTVLFVCQLFLHVGFWMTDDLSAHARRLYAIKLNTMFILKLLTLAAAGGGYVVRHSLGLFGLPRGRAVVRAPRVY